MRSNPLQNESSKPGGGLRPGDDEPSEPIAPPRVRGARATTSIYSTPVPLVYGTARVAGNVIAETKRYGALWIGVAEGPIAGIPAAWGTRPYAVHQSGPALVMPFVYDIVGVLDVARVALSMRVYTGTVGQVAPSKNYANGVLWPPAADPSTPLWGQHYGGTAYVYQQFRSVAVETGWWGRLYGPDTATTATEFADEMRSLTYEVVGLGVTPALTTSASHPSNPNLTFAFVTAGGADPAYVITDLLTHVTRGCGIEAARVADTTVYSDYCAGMGFEFNAALIEQKPAADHIASVLYATNATAIWAAPGQVKIIPLGDVAVGSYVPDNVAKYDLTQDDFLDEIEVERGSVRDIYNSWPVVYTDSQIDLKTTPWATPKANAYEKMVVENQDLSDVAVYGTKRSQQQELVGVATPEHGLVMSRIFAQRSINIRNTYRVRLPWAYLLLEPGDIVTLSDAVAGLSLQPVMITEVETQADSSVRITAQDWPAGIAHSVAYPGQGVGYAEDYDPLSRERRLAIQSAMVWTPGVLPRPTGTVGVPPFVVEDPGTLNLVAVGSATGTGVDTAWTSSDGGSNWTARSTGSGTIYWLHAAAGMPLKGGEGEAEPRVVIVGVNGVTVYSSYSDDGGLSWSAGTITTATSSNLRVKYLDADPDCYLNVPMFIIVGGNGYFWHSWNGATWTRVATPGNVGFVDVATDMQMYVFVDDYGYIHRTLDLVNWESPGSIPIATGVSPLNRVFSCRMTWSQHHGRWVVIGMSQDIPAKLRTFYSPDAANWSEEVQARSASEDISGYSLMGFAEANGLLVAAGSGTNNDYILLSPDGRRWAWQTHPYKFRPVSVTMIRGKDDGVSRLMVSGYQRGATPEWGYIMSAALPRTVLTGL